LRERRGLFGAEVVARGVETPPGGEEPVEETLGGTLPGSGVRPFSGAASGLSFAPGMGMGSEDMSMMGLRLAVEEETPKETRRRRLPPLRTSPSAIVGEEREGEEREEDKEVKMQMRS
jgi:hypothetical protein